MSTAALVPEPEDPRDFLVTHHALVRRLIRTAARVGRLSQTDQLDFESDVWLSLVDGDYRILRQFSGRSTITTYLRVVIQRLLIDYQRARWGKWRPCAASRRLGAKVVAFERLVRRDGLPVEVAASCLGLDEHTPLPVAQSRRPSEVPLTAAAEIKAPATMNADRLLRQRDRSRRRGTIRLALKSAFAALPRDEQELLRLRFVRGLRVTAIAASRGIDTKKLFRTYAAVGRRLARHLKAQGVTRFAWSEASGDD